ncbi:prepilin-type N-terminal cleavage/methylation domain-containing protein [Sphingobacterium sp. SRCM116780]|uniref:PilW family protein n=1 Tax=Sphingobacterium sp. SRCM116780 TaxID=2907623 RepID=UPI001F190B86|nr:prepilin-type N-terminal cleavage/methylation domain-containing protein [Sphingobacterium sp. SRCM116780]UIR54618.1 prepilin-type N-terminal cleavage/methylation domain-containing protein [Sphingobacterium sp. SRCM116780]
MKNKRLKAFTLMEISIALLISAICIGMAFYMFQFFQQLYLKQQQDKQARFAFSLLQHLIKKDLAQANAAYYAENQLQLVDSLGSIRYTFDQQHILRDHYQQHTDTFNLHLIAVEGKYIEPTPPSSTCIDQLQLRVDFEKSTHTFIFEKKYAATQLMQIAQANQHTN